MDHFPVLASICHSSSAGGGDWMLFSSWIGLVACVLIAVFHSYRILFLRAAQGTDVLAELCHAFMGVGMAYMFAPFAAIKVIPDTLWALSFALLALVFAVRPLIRKNHVLGDVSHSVMNLSMTYMCLQSVWDVPLVTGVFVAFFAAFTTIHAAEFVQHWRRRQAATARPSFFAEPAMSSVSHILMSAAMIFMFLMPAMMSSDTGHGHNHHIPQVAPVAVPAKEGGCCSPGAQHGCCEPKEVTPVPKAPTPQQHHHHSH